MVFQVLHEYLQLFKLNTFILTVIPINGYSYDQVKCQFAPHHSYSHIIHLPLESAIL